MTEKRGNASNAELHKATPDKLGFSPQRLAAAFQLLDDTVASRKIPGIVALIGRGNGYIGPYAVGYAAAMPTRIPVLDCTLFDMASVTKAVATTTAVLQLLEQGVWRLDDPVSRFWPHFTDGVTLRHLLTHTSGLPAWRPLARFAQGREAFKAVLTTTPLEYETGTQVVYSCLGFLVLGLLVEHVTGQSLDGWCRHNIFRPLGMADTGFNPPPGLRDRCAATEVIPGADQPLQGVVHDENARAFGGDAGNAGLFSTALDLAKFCRAILNGGIYGGNRILANSTVQLATRDHTPHLNASRGLGWVVKGNRTHSPARDLLSKRSYGHTGFTGTSIWLDPVLDLYIVLLSNRVHPTRENDYHTRLRPLFHNMVLAAADS